LRLKDEFNNAKRIIFYMHELLVMCLKLVKISFQERMEMLPSS